MNDKPSKVLLVEDNSSDALLVEEALKEVPGESFQLQWVTHLHEGLDVLAKEAADVVLLDLSLPDSHGLETFDKVYARFPDLPVILLTGLDDQRSANNAVRHGAQDYLVKNLIDGPLLQRSIRYAIERQQLLVLAEHQTQKNLALFQELEESTKEMELVDEVARIITSTLDIDQVYEKFALELKKLMQFERANISIIDKGEVHFTLKNLYGPHREGLPIGSSIPLVGTQTEHALALGQTVIVTDIANKSRFEDEDEFLKLGLRSSIATPLISNGRPIGALVLRSSDVGAYGERERAILERLASQIAPAVQNSKLYQELHQNSQEMAAMAEIGRIISSSLDIDQVYSRFADQVSRLIPFDRISVSTLQSDSEAFVTTYHEGLEFEGRQHGNVSSLVGSVIEEVISTRSGVLFHADQEGEVDAKSFNAAAALGAGIRSFLSVPLLSNDNVIGVLNFRSKTSNVYTEQHLRLGMNIGAQIAGAIANAQLFAQHQKSESALRESEARFRQLFDEAPVGYQETDEEGLITRVNNTELTMLGYSESEMLGRDFNEFLVQNVPEKEVASERNNGNKTDRAFERVFLRKDGTDFPALVESRPLMDENGRTIGSRSTIQDITKRKQAEERIQETGRLASVGELAAGVAHEVNNPLTAIVGFSQLLLMNDLPPDVRQDIERICFNAERASKIVQNLLSFARKHNPERRYLDLRSIIERTLDLKSYDFKINHIEVQSKLDEDLPHTLVDEYQVIQVLMNILANAEQAMRTDNGGGKLTIEADSLEDSIQISISDDGPGISPGDLKKIFQPFFTTKEVGVGTGLGLSICYGIIQQHGGRLWAESIPGKGTTFYIELPILSPEGGEALKSQVPQLASLLARHLLVVDDEPDIRNLLARSFESQRYTVDLAEDGLEAWSKVQRRPYDCIIADLKMPEMSGPELYRTIEAFDRNLAQRIIFITGDMVSPDTRDFVKSVENVTISKPFELVELCRQVTAIVEPS